MVTVGWMVKEKAILPEHGVCVWGCICDRSWSKGREHTLPTDTASDSLWVGYPSSSVFSSPASDSTGPIQPEVSSYSSQERLPLKFSPGTEPSRDWVRNDCVCMHSCTCVCVCVCVCVCFKGEPLLFQQHKITETCFLCFLPCPSATQCAWGRALPL
jgi:hypothetical protein